MAVSLSPRAQQATPKGAIRFWAACSALASAVIVLCVLKLAWPAQPTQPPVQPQAQQEPAVTLTCPSARQHAFLNTPHPGQQPQLLVVARKQEETSWVDTLVSLPHIVYQQPELGRRQAPNHALKQFTKGEESALYLQFIIDHYGALGQSIAFSKGSLNSWHMMEKARVLKSLRWGQHEFASLRYADMPCPSAWDCVGIALHPKWSGNWLHPRDYTNNTRLQEHADSWLVSRLWDAAFAGTLGPLPDEMTSPCCAEFVVSRERILARPLAFYEALRLWMSSTHEPSPNVARFLELTWAMIFGEPPVLPPLTECQLLYC